MNSSATAGRYSEAQGTVSEVLARHVANVRFEDLPAEAITSAKRLILDTLAVAWAGSNAAGIEANRRLLETAPPGQACQASIWGTACSASAQDAAFINSASA